MLPLILLLSFLLPFQLGFHFNNFDSTVYGFRIDYLIPTLYLTDIVAILIIFLGIRNLKFNYRYLFYIIFVIANILVSNYLVASVYKWLKVTEMLLLGIIILNTTKFDVFKNFVKPLSYSVLITGVLGILQYFNQGSIGGIFYWFGERSFLFTDPNVAPYPYSTFSHPNSFAGFLLVFGIFLLQFRKKFNIKYFWLLTSLVAINLVLTNSLNVYITILILLFLKFRPNLSFAFFSFDFSQRFVTHRLELIDASWKMIKSHFWFGVGLNNFIPNLVKVSNTFLNAWELQPVHNIFLLIFSEVGFIGFVMFCFLVFSSSSFLTLNYSLLTVLITGLSDHYWLTLQQNILLFTFTLVISKIKK